MFTIAISATFTAEPLRPVLEFWGRELRENIHLEFAPFNQVHQTLLDPAGIFARNERGANVVLVRPSDLGGQVADLLEVARQSVDRSSVPLIFCLCPPWAPESARSIEAALAEIPGLQVLTHERILSLYPVAEWSNPEGDRLGRIPFTDAYFCALGTAIARLSHTLVMPPYKAIVLDCDNTLWRGICGEDGPAGVVLDEARRALHEFLVEQREAGMLLCLASKNNEQDVFDTFSAHPEFPLQLRHFTTWRLDWGSKADSLMSIAAELGLAPDALIFIDDNPKECAEVAGSVPEILTLTLPDPVSGTPHFLDHVWAFDHPVVTEEDRQRSAYYERNQQFAREARRAASLEKFMATLKLEIDISPLTPEALPRASQLTQRTNQFNFTTRRRTEAEIAALQREGWRVLGVDVADRFGHYGQTGLVICRAEGSDLFVDTFLLSCRVLGRGVEHSVLAYLGGMTDGNVVLPVSFTPRNIPVRQFVDSLDSVEKEVSEAGFTAICPAAAIRDLLWKPTASPVAVAASKPAESGPRRFSGYEQIARSLSTVEQLLRRTRQARLVTTAAFATDTERRLAEIWAELLETASVRPEDNFFDLGGHSLLAVLLILRVREVFGIELSMDDVYTGELTLDELAARIDMHQMELANPEQYAALVAEIAALTDDEVRELLAKEDARACGSC